MADSAHWVGTWTTSPAPMVDLGFGFENQTLRMIAHTSIGGGLVRVRLSNAYGTRKLAVGAASIALRAQDAAIIPGSDRPLTFGGSASATIAAGALIVSDPVALDVPPLGDVAVSLHLPAAVAQDFAITGHGIAKQTGYISAAGDFTRAAILPVAQTTLSWFFVTGIEVQAPAGTGGIVAFGDSLTDANLSTPDINARWPDQLARRLQARHGRRFGVMNQGIGGNRILHDLAADSGLKRFDRDVLAQTGVSHVIVFLGTNDIRNWRGRREEDVTAADMIGGLAQFAVRAHAGGLAIFGATLLPFENETFHPGAYTPAGEAKRQAVNHWIRTAGAFDAVIDFDRALRDPGHPTSMLPAYDCGDHLHPSDAGYRALGDAIDLALFD